VDRGETTIERGARETGSKVVALAIGLTTFIVLVMLPFLIPVVFYLVANVYALVKGTSFSSQTANEAILPTLLVLSVALFPVLLAALIGVIGRALSPKRRGA
jgi:nitrate reductase NapE component